MPRWLVVLAVVGLIFAVMAPAAATDDEYTDGVANSSHKIYSKWDQSGTFVAHPGYNWAGMAEGATWTYKIHVKEAMDGQYSTGSIHFYTMVDGTEINVVGKVEATKRPYAYWGGTDVRAAVGTAEYNDMTYYFMFLESERAMWFALSTTSYDSCWDVGSVWGSPVCDGSRVYQLHSTNPDPDGQFDPLPEKIIHG